MHFVLPDGNVFEEGVAMPVANTETNEVAQEATAADRIADAVRHAAHFSHEARLLRSMARDAGEEGIHAAKRAIRRARRGVEALEDFRDEAVHCVKRQPLKAIGKAAGVGLVVGAIVGWIGRSLGQRQLRKGREIPV